MMRGSHGLGDHPEHGNGKDHGNGSSEPTATAELRREQGELERLIEEREAE